MRRCVLTVIGVCVTVCCAGCKIDYADKLIRPPGRPSIAMAALGDSDRLREQRRIDLAERFVTADGTEIDVWVVKSRLVHTSGPSTQAGGVTRGTVVLLHNLGDYKASNLSLAGKLAKMGFDVVLPDLRGHGYSTGEYVTYGAREKHDVKIVMDGLLQQGAVGEPIYAFGVSLGGAIAIEYAAVDPRCKGVMAISPPNDARDIMRRRIALDAPFMSDEKFDAVVAEAGRRADFDPAETSALAAAGKLTCPLLLVHGLIDLNVPLSNSEELLKAAKGPRKLIVITPGPEQGLLLLIWDDWNAEKIAELVATGLGNP